MRVPGTLIRLHQMFKFITAFGARSFSVAGLREDPYPSDSESYRFSFTVYSVSVGEFCKVIYALHANAADPDKYAACEDVVIKTSSMSDALRITREGHCLNITRGNLKVIYSGRVSDVYVLCKQLEVDYSAHIQPEYDNHNG